MQAQRQGQGGVLTAQEGTPPCGALGPLPTQAALGPELAWSGEVGQGVLQAEEMHKGLTSRQGRGQCLGQLSQLEAPRLGLFRD